jgi:hypothetical protein
MLSGKLVRLIESHWEEIAARLVRALQTHPDAPVLGGRPEGELRQWCGDMLEDLGALLTAGRDEDVASRFRIAGRARFEQEIPLAETVLRFHLLREKIVGFIHERGLPSSALELYAEEELEERIGRFFDAAVYSVVRGYEEAMRRAARIAS